MPNPTNHVIDAGVQIGHKLTVGGSVTAVGSGAMSWLTENYQAIASLGVLAGIVVGVSGLVITYYYQRKRDRREEAAHQARLRQISGEL